MLFAMFVRIKPRPNGTKSIQIVENVRKGDKVIQKVIRHFGQGVSDWEIERLSQMAEEVIIRMKDDRNPVLPIFNPKDFHSVKTRRTSIKKEQEVDLLQLRETDRLNTGIEDIFGTLYAQLNFDTLLGSTAKEVKWNDILKKCVLTRIAEPSSKRQTVKIVNQDFGIELNLNQVYRMMDRLFKREGEIKHHVSQLALNLFKESVDVVFFDVTTLYFESFEADELRNFGFSKDCKFNQTQVVLALVTNRDGIPITYELFPGNMYEGKTLIEIIENLKNNYDVKNIVLVADRAMFNEANLSLMEENEIRYVVAAKLRSMSAAIKDEILSEKAYQACVISNELQWSKTIQLPETPQRQVLVSYSPKRAKKDHADRQRLIEKLLKKVKNRKLKLTQLVNNTGSKKFIRVVQDEAVMDEQKIQNDAQWDGLHGVITNIQDQHLSSILERYRGLWKIEEAFRINKNDLKMRPIYHFTERRIRAHMSLCFLAYTLVAHANRILTEKGLHISFNQLREELLRAQCSLLRNTATQEIYSIPSKTTEVQNLIYQAFDMQRMQDPLVLTKII